MQLLLHVVVVEVAAKNLGQVQHAKSNVDRFVETDLGFSELYTVDVLLEDGATVEVGLCDQGLGSVASFPARYQFNVDVFANVLHGPVEHCGLHELEQILFEIIVCFFLISLFRSMYDLSHGLWQNFNDADWLTFCSDR